MTDTPPLQVRQTVTMTAAERREFVRKHRTCIYGYERRNGPPSMSIVYYTMDGDDILISTMAKRAKALVAQRNPEVSLCILDGKWPPSYLLVYGRATLDFDPKAGVDMFMKLKEIMTGVPTPESERPAMEEMCAREERIVVRVTPLETFETPPRQMDPETDPRTVFHNLGATLAWNDA